MHRAPPPCSRLPLPGVDADSLARRIEQPRVGRLVLFPTMMFHGTTPFDDDAPRLTIAFDAVPDFARPGLHGRAEAQLRVVPAALLLQALRHAWRVLRGPRP